MSIQHDDLVNKFSQMLEDNPTTLDLVYHSIGDKRIKALATALSTSSLTAIHLGVNRIGPEGVKILANALPKSSLTILDLQYNWIGDEGVKALAAILPISSLTTLNLQGNRITGAGTKALASVLLTSSLTTLGLGLNEIGNKGIQCLKEVVSTPGCRIYKTGLVEIDKDLQSKQEKLLAAADRLLSNHQYVPESSFRNLCNDEKIFLLFKIKDSQIKCRNQFMQHFMSKDSDCTNKIGASLPIKELSQHIMSFVFPILSDQDISKSWVMAEDKLTEITKQSANTTQLTRMTGN